MTKGSYSLRKTKASGYTLRITITDIKVKGSRAGRRYDMVDIDEMLDDPIMLDGAPLRPRLVLKMFRELGEMDVIRLNNKRCPIKLPDAILL